MLFGPEPHNIPTFIFAVALLAVIALLASWIPVQKASHLDPVAALRAE
jgi:ABC-type lipoprotein release transport system permease subunit